MHRAETPGFPQKDWDQGGRVICCQLARKNSKVWFVQFKCIQSNLSLLSRIRLDLSLSQNWTCDKFSQFLNLAEGETTYEQHFLTSLSMCTKRGVLKEKKPEKVNQIMCRG